MKFYERCTNLLALKIPGLCPDIKVRLRDEDACTLALGDTDIIGMMSIAFNMLGIDRLCAEYLENVWQI